MENKSHFGGKTIPKHLKEARKKGKRAMHESHGSHTKDHFIAGSDAAKEAAIIALLFWIVSDVLSLTFDQKLGCIFITLLGFLFWKVGRSAILGWARLEKINRLIQEEYHEITTNREEERSELTEIYRAKGFSGELLDRVIDVLMADDNKLLSIMLEEELGVMVSMHEHPLKLSLGSFIGILVTMIVLFIGAKAHAEIGVFFSSYMVIFIASWIVAKIERIRFLYFATWNLGITFLSSTGIYFLARFITHEVVWKN